MLYLFFLSFYVGKKILHFFFVCVCVCVCVCVFITQFWVIFLSQSQSISYTSVLRISYVSVLCMFSETKAREESVLHRGRSGEVGASLC